MRLVSTGSFLVCELMRSDFSKVHWAKVLIRLPDTVLI